MSGTDRSGTHSLPARASDSPSVTVSIFYLHEMGGSREGEEAQEGFI